MTQKRKAVTYWLNLFRGYPSYIFSGLPGVLPLSMSGSPPVKLTPRQQIHMLQLFSRGKILHPPHQALQTQPIPNAHCMQEGESGVGGMSKGNRPAVLGLDSEIDP